MPVNYYKHSFTANCIMIGPSEILCSSLGNLFALVSESVMHRKTIPDITIDSVSSIASDCSQGRGTGTGRTIGRKRIQMKTIPPEEVTNHRLIRLGLISDVTSTSKNLGVRKCSTQKTVVNQVTPGPKLFRGTARTHFCSSSLPTVSYRWRTASALQPP